MIKGIQVSLYEVFGYLIPGAFFSFGVGLLSWGMYLPSVALTAYSLSTTLQIGLLCIFYVAGHLAQAISNLLSGALILASKQMDKKHRINGVLRNPEWVILSEDSVAKMPGQLLHAVSEKLIKLKIFPENSILARSDSTNKIVITEEWLYRACDEAVFQRGKLEDRNLYIYREGFYRGLWVSSVLIFVALLLRFFRGQANVRIENKFYDLNENVVPFLLAATSLSSFFWYARYRRFGRYRVSQAVLGFLALAEGKKKPSEDKKEDDDAD